MKLLILVAAALPAFMANSASADDAKSPQVYVAVRQCRAGKLKMIGEKRFPIDATGGNLVANDNLGFQEKVLVEFSQNSSFMTLTARSSLAKTLAQLVVQNVEGADLSSNQIGAHTGNQEICDGPESEGKLSLAIYKGVF